MQPLNFGRAGAFDWSRQATLRLIKHDAPAVSDLPKVIVTNILLRKKCHRKDGLDQSQLLTNERTCSGSTFTLGPMVLDRETARK